MERRPLPPWGPADLAAALPPGPIALMDGLMAAGRRCVLVAWAPAARAATLPAAFSLTAGLPVDSRAPTLLGAAVGALAWDGAAAFWLPGAAALFDPAQGALWHRGELPDVRLGGATAPPSGTEWQTARPLWERDDFCAAVDQSRRRMAGGDLQKVVLSVPFTAPCPLTPLAVYRRLAAGGAPGLRFLLDTGPDGWALAGASPEPLVTLTGRLAELHPLAGTRPDRGSLPEQLLTSAKDRVEHGLAVEQCRSDLLAVCTPGSVTIEAFMALERHPGLVHLASHLSGTLRDDAAPADLVQACFPAGTVVGVPRQPAVALIQELEPTPRLWYAGGVGALLPGGDLQLWLTIRSAWLSAGTVRVQAGAGMVPGSRPELEWRECLAKAGPTLAAAGAKVVAHAHDM